MTAWKVKSDKVWAVCAVHGGEISVTEAAQQLGVTEQAVWNWRRAFLDAGASALEPHDVRIAQDRELALSQEIRALTASLREAEVELAVRRRNEVRLPIEDLEEIRVGADMTVPKFATLVGVPRRTYLEQVRDLAVRRAHTAPAPTPAAAAVRSAATAAAVRSAATAAVVGTNAGAVDEDRDLVAKYAALWPSYGPRQIWALMQSDGHRIAEHLVNEAMTTKVSVSA